MEPASPALPFGCDTQIPFSSVILNPNPSPRLANSESEVPEPSTQQAFSTELILNGQILLILTFDSDSTSLVVSKSTFLGPICLDWNPGTLMSAVVLDQLPLLCCNYPTCKMGIMIVTLQGYCKAVVFEFWLASESPAGLAETQIALHPP